MLGLGRQARASLSNMAMLMTYFILLILIYLFYLYTIAMRVLNTKAMLVFWIPGCCPCK